MQLQPLPLPALDSYAFGPLTIATDEALYAERGIRVAFAERHGGKSTGPYESLNLATTVGDDESIVLENRALVAEALTSNAAFPFIVPKQVHETTVLVADESDAPSIAHLQAVADEGADGIIIATTGVGALLNFADCVPVIVASPTGKVAVVHAGWRGVAASIVPIAIESVAELDKIATQLCSTDLKSEYNVYIGAYIHRECFETSEDVHSRFVEKFGPACSADGSHIDLGIALKTDLERAGISPQRVADLDVCTVCTPERFFSFRYANGTCGRHGALAYSENVR